jgi:subtilisin family serine protease
LAPKKRDRQETLGRSTEEHIFISPEIVSAKASESSTGRRRWGAKRGDVPPEVLRDQAEKVRQASDRKAMIVLDPNVYFVIAFSDTFRSPIIRRVLEKLRVQPVDVVNDKEAKVKVRKSEYSTFLRNLESNSAYVKSIRESTVNERIDKSLLAQVEANPDIPFRVRIELTGSPEVGLDAVHALEQYLQSKNVEIEKNYYSRRFWLITAELLGKFVQEVGENSDGISRINLASAIKLHSSGFSAIPLDEGRTNRVRTSSLRTTPISPTAQNASLPILCVLDTGINRDHKLIKPYVVGTYDFISRSDGPCSDDEGHGSKVAGLAIYGGDVTSGSPVSRVIAVKLMAGDTFGGDILKAIQDTVQKFKNQTKIFNLSFGTQGPEPGLSRALDYYAFTEGVLFVVSAGNISPDQIIDDVGNGNGYPGYLLEHWVYFPGDCYNVLTVGSYATKDSNFVQQQRPSPFTRTCPPRDFAKPEVLASGGNMNLERQGGRITGFNAIGCGVISTARVDDSLVEDVGTSFSSPTVASVVAEIAQKFPQASTCLLKGLGREFV